ncbi:MAG: glycosyltransferase family 4 protein [Anaerolineales bacterium]|nr:glycosyltransferase family 4 protein [Anaerolineales bacterium]
MHLALVLYGSLETLSGGYLYDRKLVAHLRAQGDTVDVIGLPWRNYGRHLLDNLSRDLRRRLTTGSWDLILQDELNHPSLFALNEVLLSRPPRVAIVHHLRCSEERPAWQNALYRRVERRYLQSVHAAVFNSQTTRAVSEAVAGRALPGVVAYPAGDRFGPGPQVADVEARAHEAGPLRLLFLGNLIARKGLHTLLDALATLSAPWTLTVIGGAPEPAYAAQVQGQAARLGLRDRIRWSGPVPDADVRAALLAHQALVVPSSYEGFGIAYLEALRFGLPVLATTAGAAAEVITPEREGALVAPNDPAAVAAVLDGWARARGRLADLSRAALARAQAFPTWEETGARIRHYLLGLSA